MKAAIKSNRTLLVITSLFVFTVVYTFIHGVNY